MGTPRYADMVLHKEYTGAAPSRAQAFEDLVLYVDATNGNDYNDGSADYPFKTAQGVADYLKLWDGNGHNLTIYFADGTYDGQCTWSGITGWFIWRIQGNDTNPENVIITYSSATTYDNVWWFFGTNAWIAISGLYMKGPAAGTGYLMKFTDVPYAEIANYTYDGKMKFGHARVAIYVDTSQLFMYQTIEIDASITMNYFMYAGSLSNVGIYADAINLLGNVSTSIFLYGGFGGMLDEWSTAVNNSGTLTGKPYDSGGYGKTALKPATLTALGGTTPTTIVDYQRDFMGHTGIKQVAKAALPTGVPAGCLAYVTDDVGGATLAWFNGTNWKRAYDNATVS